ncbi:MAG: hypothetical protein BV458_12950 [Thermoplasmata archaeon M9B2D]|nr:MAG: hypothetical protein BV458_12950 [Thermoplasmata archaeon M9B2D]
MAKRSGMYKMEKRKKELKRKKKKEEKMLNRLKANQEHPQDIEQSEQPMDAGHSSVDDSEDNDDE